MKFSCGLSFDLKEGCIAIDNLQGWCEYKLILSNSYIASCIRFDIKIR